MKTGTAVSAAIALALGVFTTGGASAAPQAAPPPQQPEAAEQAVPVFGAESSVVLLDVVVRDKKGRLVKDLKPSDFEVYEDGQKQEVTSFKIFDNEGPGPAAAEAAPSAAPAAAPAAPSGAAPAAAAPAAPSEAAPTSPSVIAFVFDRLSTEGRDNARKAAEVYVTKGHVDGDVVGVFNIDLTLRTTQPFTTDLNAVRAAFDRAGMLGSTPFADVRDEARKQLDTADRAADAQAGAAPGSAAAASLGVEQLFASMQANMLQSFDRLERDQQGFASTNGLLAVVNGLKALPGRKTVVFFSEGLSISSSVLEQFQSVIASANRANVTVYAIDAGGLRTLSNTKDARDELVRTAQTRMRQESTGSVGLSDGPLTRGMERSEDMLRSDPHAGLGRLAEETGGFLVADTNDASKGFARIQEEMRFYYLLSYSPTNPAFDGRFRTINVKVDRPGVEVHSRKGYLAVAPNTAVPVRTYEGPAIAELDRKPRPTDFPLDAVALSFPETKRPGRVPVLVEMSAKALSFSLDEKQKAYKADFSIVARLRDSHGREVDRLSQEYPLTVPADKIEAARNGNVLFFKETDLVPGHYTLEAVAYDSQGKKASVKTGAVDVPQATSGEVRLSSLVLLSKVEKLSEAEKSADNPLHYGDTILYPNMGEPFRKSLMPALGFYFNVYCPDVTPPKQAIVELVKNGQVTAKIPTTLDAPDANGRIQHAAALPLQSLAPGAYALRVAVANGTSTVTRETPFVVAE
jgi:VWFA-related protein